MWLPNPISPKMSYPNIVQIPFEMGLHSFGSKYKIQTFPWLFFKSVILNICVYIYLFIYYFGEKTYLIYVIITLLFIQNYKNIIVRSDTCQYILCKMLDLINNTCS